MTDREPPRGATAKITGEVAAFCTLSLLGGGLFALVALTNIDWFYPTLFYGAVVYVAAQRYFYVGDGSPELDLEYERAQNTILQTYLDQMTELLLKEGLREKLLKIRDAKPTIWGDVDVAALARAQTLTVLQRLDGERKRSVVLFLYESHLIGGKVPLLDPIRTEYEFRLGGGNVPLLDPHRADLQSANLGGLALPSVGLPGANLREADLRGSNLRGADLSRADLSRADLSRADLNEAFLEGAFLSGVDLSSAYVTDEQLATCWSLDGATMPDGQTLRGDKMPNGPTFEDWLREHE
jgi:hypothetical protein